MAEHGEQRKRKYTSYRMSIFLITFISYAFFHMAKKTFSNVKTTISEEWTPTQLNSSSPITPHDVWNDRRMFSSPYEAEPFLGILDASFLVAYAVGLYISGLLGDRFDLRCVLAIGLSGSALCMFIFGCVLEWVHFYNKYMYVAVRVLNGLFQSTGWPTVVALMGNWFGKSSRGFVFGLWSSCAPVGNIMGSVMVSRVLDYGYDYAFLFISAILLAGAIVVMFGVVSSPDELEPPKATVTATTVSDELNIQIEKDNKRHRSKGISLIRAILLPGVILYSFAYTFLKLVNYSVFFWLPYYLTNDFHWKETLADSISIWYDIGGIVGGTVGGIISDRFEERALVLLPMIALGIPSLFAYASSPADLTVNSVLMAVAGFFINGVANLVSAAVAADLGREGSVNVEAQATVTGVIDGTGSIGAAIGQILVPIIQQSLGWRAVFYFFMGSLFMTGMCMLPMFVADVKKIYRKRTSCCGRNLTDKQTYDLHTPREETNDL